jgi:hypothetical protein
MVVTCNDKNVVEIDLAHSQMHLEKDQPHNPPSSVASSGTHWSCLTGFQNSVKTKQQEQQRHIADLQLLVPPTSH